MRTILSVLSIMIFTVTGISGPEAVPRPQPVKGPAIIIGYSYVAPMREFVRVKNVRATVYLAAEDFCLATFLTPGFVLSRSNKLRSFELDLWETLDSPGREIAKELPKGGMYFLCPGTNDEGKSVTVLQHFTEVQIWTSK